MPRQYKLSAEHQEIAEAGAKKLFHYEMACEKHTSILRSDPIRCAEAYELYTKAASKQTFRPTRKDLPGVMQELEKFLQQEEFTFVEHVQGMNASLYYCFLLGIQLSEISDKVKLEAMRLSNEMLNQYLIEHPPSHLAHLNNTPAPMPSPEPDTGLDYPPVMPTKERLSFAEIEQFRRVPVTATDIANIRTNLELVQREVFVTMVDDELQAFKVICFLTIGEEKIFYVLFSDDNEAYAHHGQGMFDLLAESERVVRS